MVTGREEAFCTCDAQSSPVKAGIGPVAGGGLRGSRRKSMPSTGVITVPDSLADGTIRTLRLMQRRCWLLQATSGGKALDVPWGL